MVVVGCGLWTMTVAMVVGCGGDSRWWLSVLLMIMGELCLSLVVGFFFCNLVDLMVVVGCGLLAVTVAVVVGCEGDGRWWLSVLLMIMGEGIIYYFNA